MIVWSRKALTVLFGGALAAGGAEAAATGFWAGAKAAMLKARLSFWMGD